MNRFIFVLVIIVHFCFVIDLNAQHQFIKTIDVDLPRNSFSQGVLNSNMEYILYFGKGNYGSLYNNLLRFDTNMNIISSTRLEDSAYPFTPVSISSQNNNVYIKNISLNPSHTFVSLVKANSVGMPLWGLKTEGEHKFSFREQSLCTNESRAFFSCQNNEKDIFIYCVNEVGKTIYSKTIPFSENLSITSIKSDLKNSLFISGSIGSFSNFIDEEPFLAKFDSIGNLEWAKVYTLPEDGLFASVDNINDKIIVTGLTQKRLNFITCISESGEVEWSMTLKEIGSELFISSIEKGSDGNILFSALYNTAATVEKYPVFGEIDKHGKLIYSLKIQPQYSLGTGITVNSIFKNNNNKIFLSGRLSQSLNKSQPIVISGLFNELRNNTCCFDTAFVLTEFFNAKDSSISFIYSNADSLESYELKWDFTDFSTNNLCDSLPVNLEYQASLDSSCLGECINLQLLNPTEATNYSWQYSYDSMEFLLKKESFLHCSPFENMTLIANRNGCTASREIEIPIREVDNIAFPNAFTPDGDSLNDDFRPISYTDCPYVDYRLQIYNRWGNLVFESRDFTQGWDGRMPDGQLAASDVYIYKALFSADIQGEVISLTKHGEVHLLR